MGWIRKLFVGILGTIDSVVYSLVSSVYNLLIDIAQATPFDDQFFSEFASRIYALLGLFMLFKVSFSLIKYIVNPDEFKDQSKGGKKLIINILVVLLLIVVTPSAFRVLREVQTILVKDDDVMSKLILGNGVYKDGEKTPVDKRKVGEEIKVAIFTSFYQIDDGGGEGSCSELVARGVSEDDEAMNQACDQFFATPGVGAAYVKAKNEGSVYDLIHKEIDGDPIFMQKSVNADLYGVDYKFIVSTAIGVLAALLFLSFCFDIAIRTVKFGFLELISPIPIISYIDPNSAKSGIFNKWIKQVISTYLDLFVRLGAVYFGISLISALMYNSDLGTTHSLARVFIIIGILLFVKKIPDLLKDIFGLKLDSSLNLNPMSRLRETPILGAVGTGLAGFAGGAYAGVKAGREVGQKGILSGAIGGLSGARESASKVGMMGAKAGAQAPKAFGNSMNSVFKQMTNREMRNLNPVNMMAGRSVKGRLAQVKSARDNATARLTAAQVSQEAAYHQMQRSSQALSKLSEPERQAFLQKAGYYSNQVKIRDDKNKSEAERQAAMENIARVKQEIASTYTGEYADVARHFEDRVAAQEANSLVTNINREIDDLSTEKSQLERYGHIDPAATRDVNSLLDKYASAPEDITIETPPGSAPRNERETSGGIPVRRNENGDITTPSGLILNDRDLDDRNRR